MPDGLAAAHGAYASTYVLEDAYLRALVRAAPRRRFDSLPQTEHAQRAAILAWRHRLEAMADQLDLRLPADVRVAGEGEIVPSPLGE